MAGFSGGPTVFDILSRPFGPFLDSTVLSPECKTTPQNPIEMRNVLLEQNGEPTGLTYCEWTQPEACRDTDVTRPVRLRGLLCIKTLSWLSEEGRNLLTKALRGRDYNIRRKKYGSATQESNLTLGSVFDKDGKLHSKKTCIKLIVQATKEGPAVYMNSNLAPESLVIRTADHNRTYKILSMDCETYERSHLYLSRYRLLHDLRTIISMPRTNSTPLADRTPEWFVSQYVEHLVYQDEDHSADGSASSESSDQSSTEELYLPPSKQRTVRHISRAEVFSLLATHANWLIKEQKEQKFKKLFDPSAWGRFQAEAVKYRRKARLENLQWGTFRGATMTSEDTDSTGSEDETRVDEPASRSRVRKRTASAAAPRNRRLPTKVDSNIQETTHHTLDSDHENHYDSDFTTDGSSSVDSDDGSLCSRSNSPSPACAAGLPYALLVPPKLPNNGSWICPVEGCLYDINLRGLRKEQLELLWPQNLQYTMTGGWRLDESRIIDCFRKLVNEHYRGHLSRLGLAVVKQGNQRKLKSTVPRSRKPEYDMVPSSQDTVKEEPFSQGS